MPLKSFQRFTSLGAMLVMLLIFSLLVQPTKVMAVSSGDVTINLRTMYLASDSNCSTTFPNGGYIEVSVTNNTATTLTNLKVDLTNIVSSGDQGGVILDPTESATRMINSLAPGDTAYLYFFVNYPCSKVKNNRPRIDFKVKVTDIDDGSNFTTANTFGVQTEQAISANAGGDIVSMTLGAGAVVGQIIPLTVNYSFGNIGNTNPSFNIQPTGDAAFDPSCYRLVATDITAGSGWQTSGGTPVDLTAPQYDNQLNFAGITNPNGSTLTVVYYYEVLCTNPAGTIMKPFAASNSGTQVKYIPNNGTCTSTPCQNQFVTPVPPSFQISKTASQQYFLQSPVDQFVTFTVTITNTSMAGTPPQPVSSRIDKITDLLPTSLFYQNIATGSQVTASNSSSLPATNSSGTLTFVGQPTTKITNGQLDGSYLMAAGGTLTLKYTVLIPANTNVGDYTNTVTASTGTTTSPTATSTIHILVPTAVTMLATSAEATSSSVVVRWQTGSENDVNGFNIYRATRDNRASAVKLNSSLIYAQGMPSRYSFNDLNVEAGVRYYYWIEVVNNGQPNQEFGPLMAVITEEIGTVEPAPIEETKPIEKMAPILDVMIQ